MPKRDVRVRITCGVEPCRIMEPLWIAICGADHRKHQGASGDGLSMKLHIAARRAHHPLQRRTKPEHFLNRGRQKVRRSLQSRKLIAVLQ